MTAGRSYPFMENQYHQAFPLSRGDATYWNMRLILTLFGFISIPGTASALSLELLSIGRPDLIIPMIIFLEVPFAIWITGFLGVDDRKTIRSTLSSILSIDFTGMDVGGILRAIFFGEQSVVSFLFRIWLALMAAALCAFTFGQIEPLLRHKLELPPIGILLMSFSLFSYVFIRNLCEDTLRDQIGHAFLSATFCGAIFTALYHMV